MLNGPKVKGISFRTNGLVFAEVRGVEARDRALELMPREVADGFRYQTLLATSWYPIEWYRATFEAYRRATNEGLDLPRELGKLGARRDMASVYKQMLARIISPQVMLSLSSRVFNSYYDTGSYELAASRSGFMHARVTGCLGWDENLWSELLGANEALLEMAGARHVRLRVIAGGQNSDTSAEIEGRWT